MTDIEQKLSEFNSRTANAKLMDYLAQGNIFEEIGKSRDDMTHSKMLKSILLLNNRPSSPFLPLKHLLDALVTRDSQQNEIMDDTLRHAILTNSIQIKDIEECKVEYTLGQYVKEHPSCAGFKDKKEESESNIEKDRLDLYIKCNICGCKRNVLELFIENKVNHKEKDGQTKKYYNVCKPCEGKGNNKSSYQLFIYLSPLSSSLLFDYQHLSQPNKPQCNQYIQINYQDVLDYVISPILEDSTISERQRFILTEYVNCLELPSLINADNKSPRELTIMATSQMEKELINKFMACEENQVLINASMAVAEKEKLYQVADRKYLTKDDAIRYALREYVMKHSKWGSLRHFAPFIGKQGGDYPFLVYAAAQTEKSLLTIPDNWYVWENELYPSFLDAMIALIPCYARKYDLDDFSSVYCGRGGGMLISDKPKANFTECQCGEDSYYINQTCGLYVVRINEVLQAHEFPPIITIGETEYEQLVSTNKWVAKYRPIPKDMYVRLDDTRFYYRSSVDMEKILQDDKLDCHEITNDKEYDLLQKFYKKNKNLVISVMKILLDDMDNADSRNKKCSRLEKLLRQ